MKRTLKYFAMFVVVFSVAFIGCKKKVQPGLSSIKNPCDCAKEVSADFTMEEMTETNTNFAKYTITDSIFGDKNVRFTALEKNAEYIWILGSETETTKVTQRFFYNNMVGQDFPITLIVKKKPNTICFPNDDGLDTITKRIYVRHSGFGSYGWVDSDNIFLEGNYKMKTNLLQDSIIIQVDVRKIFGESKFMIYNWNGEGATDTLYSNVNINYTELFLVGRYCSPFNSGCFLPYVTGNITNQNNKVEMNFFQETLGGNPKIDWNYIGRKL